MLGCWGAGVLGCWGAGVLGVLGCWRADCLLIPQDGQGIYRTRCLAALRRIATIGPRNSCATARRSRLQILRSKQGRRQIGGEQHRGRLRPFPSQRVRAVSANCHGLAAGSCRSFDRWPRTQVRHRRSTGNRNATRSAGQICMCQSARLLAQNSGVNPHASTEHLSTRAPSTPAPEHPSTRAPQHPAPEHPSTRAPQHPAPQHPYNAPGGFHGRFPSRLRPSVCSWWFRGPVRRSRVGPAEPAGPGILARPLRLRRSILEIGTRAVRDAGGPRRAERREPLPRFASRARSAEARE